MHITVHCPSCRTLFRLNPEMRGKRTRCPNAICREVFEVREEAAEPPEPAKSADPSPIANEEAAPSVNPRRPPTPPEKPYIAGSIGDLVPFLTVEAAEPSPASAPSAPAEPVSEAPAAAETPSWQEPPPVRRRSSETLPAPSSHPPAPPVEPPPVRAPKVSKPKETNPPAVAPASEKVSPLDAPQQEAARNWEPPPIRRKPVETQSVPPAPKIAQVTHTLPAGNEEEFLPPPIRRNSAKWAILVMVAFVLAVAGIGIWYGTTQEVRTESDLAQKAKEAYDSGDYSKAASLYEQLIKNFGESESAGEYRFLKELCGVRRDVAMFGVDAGTSHARVDEFVGKYANDELLKSHRGDVWDTYRKLIDKWLPNDAEQKITVENCEQTSKQYEKARKAERESQKYAPANDIGTPADLKKRFDSVQAALEKFKLVVDQIAKIENEKSWTMERFQALDQENKWLGLDQNPKIKALMQKAAQALLFDDNRFFPRGKITPLPIPAEDTAVTLVVAPRVDPPAGAAPKSDGVVFALARGVLHALSERDGHVLWFVRVGIDTSTLPVRLPKGEANRELVLVLSSDSNTLTARDAQTGAAQWQYRLSAPCLGRPVPVGRRAYVPTIDGRVHEIEIVAGNLLGEYRLSLGLTGAGTHQEGTNLLYFPANRDFIYVIDVEKKRCVAMLQTDHPSGSLRGDPIIVSDDGPAPGGDVQTRPRYLIVAMTDGLDAMRLRAYPLPIQGMAHIPPLQPEPRVRGWSWFQPSCDGEKVVLTTDAGILGLYGINQHQNQDQPLFPLFPNEIKLEGDTSHAGRAQVVHVADQDFWAIAQGSLQQWRMGWGPEGQKAAAVWPQPLPLGSPLHAAQVSRNGDTLFVVTQSSARPVCLATAVEAATGKIRWQRQLGLTVQDQLLPLADRIAALDRGGGLFVFHPDKEKPVVPPARGETSAPALYLFRGPDNGSVFVLARPTRGKLTIQRHNLVKNESGEPQEFSVPASLAGTPAIAGNQIVMPLANGMLARQSLSTKSGGVETVFYWRAPHADAGAKGHVVYLGNDEFLFSDGSTGLARVALPPKSVYSTKVETTLDNRIIAAPLLLPADSAPRACVADAAGNLILLDAIKLKPIRTWPLEGKITAGPFLRGKRIGCIVDRRTLVWLDPALPKPLWKYMVPGDGIVGQPRRIGDSVVVADFSGHFLALDAETGQPRGPGYTLKASVAPAAAPAGYGPDRIFAPLTDGTILLLTREQLEK